MNQDRKRKSDPPSGAQPPRPWPRPRPKPRPKSPPQPRPESPPQPKKDAAILLYQHDEVTLSRAAELAGIHRFEFEAELEAKGISKTVEIDGALQTSVSRIKDNTNGV